MMWTCVKDSNAFVETQNKHAMLIGVQGQETKRLQGLSDTTLEDIITVGFVKLLSLPPKSYSCCNQLHVQCPPIGRRGDLTGVMKKHAAAPVALPSLHEPRHRNCVIAVGTGHISRRGVLSYLW